MKWMADWMAFKAYFNITVCKISRNFKKKKEKVQPSNYTMVKKLQNVWLSPLMWLTGHIRKCTVLEVEWVRYTHTHLDRTGKRATSSSGTATSHSLAASAAGSQSYQGNRLPVPSFPLLGVGLNESCWLCWEMIRAHRFCGFGNMRVLLLSMCWEMFSENVCRLQMNEKHSDQIGLDPNTGIRLHNIFFNSSHSSWQIR